MAHLYASLVGPLLGLFYPIPKEAGGDKDIARAMLQSSKLHNMWCSIYTHDEVVAQTTHEAWTSIMLPDNFAYHLDYDSHKVLGKDKS